MIDLERVHAQSKALRRFAFCLVLALVAVGCGSHESTTDRSRNVADSGVTYSGCTADQASIAEAARVKAVELAAQSADYFRARSTGKRYTTWFGAVTTERWNSVAATYDKITVALAGNLDITCNDPQCSSNSFTFSYPTATNPHVLYVCGAFWTAQTTGADSQGGSLIHEITHAIDIAQTGDFQYGGTAAMSLAISDPVTAVKNADNYEYFAENPTNIVDEATTATTTSSTATTSTTTATTTTIASTTTDTKVIAQETTTSSVETKIAPASSTSVPQVAATTITTAPQPPTTLSPSAPTVGKRRITITCKRLTVKKRVTGVNPRCPAGYKKV